MCCTNKIKHSKTGNWKTQNFIEKKRETCGIINLVEKKIISQLNAPVNASDLMRLAVTIHVKCIFLFFQHFYRLFLPETETANSRAGKIVERAGPVF